MQDAWRAYLEMALGLTEASRKKARKVAKDLVGKGGATAAQLQDAATELMATSKANRETLSRLVRYEVDRALGAVGLATAEELSELTARVRDLERRLRGTTAATEVATAAATLAEPATPEPATARKTAAVKTTAAKTTAEKTTAEKTTAEKTAKKTTPRKAPAKKTTAKKAPARKSTATKTTAKKSAGTAG